MRTVCTPTVQDYPVAFGWACIVIAYNRDFVSAWICAVRKAAVQVGIPDTRAGAPEGEEGIEVRQVESQSHSFVLVENCLDVIDGLILSNSGASGRNEVPLDGGNGVAWSCGD